MEVKTTYRDLFEFLAKSQIQHEVKYDLPTLVSKFEELTVQQSEADLAKCLTGWIWNDGQNQQLWDYWKENLNIHSENTFIGSIIDVVFMNQYTSYVIEGVLDCRHITNVDPMSKLELDVVKSFSEISKVQCIYTDTYLNRKRFLIMTSNEKYEDELMDELLDIEFKLRSLYSDLRATYSYIPRTLQSDNEIISKHAKLIYERGFDVYLASTRISSTTERTTSTAITH